MPNWCYNKITIRAGEKVRNEIKKFLKGELYHRPFDREGKVLPLEPYTTHFSFHNVIPQPDHLLESDDPRRTSNVPRAKDNKDTGMPEWYNWRCNNWGTKWDVSDVAMSESKVALIYEFDTAWAPPEPVIRRLSALFPSAYITMTFSEEGMGFKGSASYKEGMIVKETGCGV